MNQTNIKLFNKFNMLLVILILTFMIIGLAIYRRNPNLFSLNTTHSNIVKNISRQTSAALKIDAATAQSIKSSVASDLAPPSTPSSLQSNDQKQSINIQPVPNNSSTNLSSTGSLQSNANINDPAVANNPLVQSIMTGN